PCVNKATRVTGRGGLSGRGEVEEELTVSFRSWAPGIDNSFESGSPLWHLRRDVVEHALSDLRITHHTTLAHVGRARLELRLDENERAPAGRGASESSGQSLRQRDERNVGGDEGGSKRQRIAVERSHVRPLEDGHPRVRA